MDCGKEDVIIEESECDDKSYIEDSCIEEEDEEDFKEEENHGSYDENSLAFERAFDDTELIHKQMLEAKNEHEKLRQIVHEKDKELSESSEAIKTLQIERESLKRQLEDLQSTLEYQEAKMDRQGSSSRSSTERRSLRRKKSSVGRNVTSPEPESALVRLYKMPIFNSVEEILLDENGFNLLQGAHKVEDRCEMELKLSKATSQIDHLRSQNDVLQLTLDDAKNTSEKLSIQLARHESNGTALQLALAYADQVKLVPKIILE